MIAYGDRDEIEDDPTKFILKRVQEILEVVRIMREPDSDQPIQSFSCSLELGLKSGANEIWDIEFKRNMEMEDYDDE
jgi:hypothetical protein